MDDTALKGSGPSFTGPSFIADLARMGGALVGPQISGAPVLTGTNGAAYGGFTATTKGGTAPLVYALVGTWPSGLSINTSTGAVSGTIGAAGTFAGLSVKVTDANSEESQLPTFTLVVAA